MIEAAEVLTDAFRASMKHIYKDPLTEDDAKARMAASILQEDGRSRISHFKQLLPEAELKRVAEPWDEVYDDLLSVLHDESDGADREDFPYAVTSMHEFDLITDIEQFIQSCGRTWRARLQKTGRLVLSHGMDITKTAIGTGIGAAIAIYSSRH